LHLAIWLTGTPSSIFLGQIVNTFDWENATNATSLAISMTVNALVMGLIVLKIFKVFQEVKATSAEKNLGATGGRKLQSIIFILIESGVALFSIQLACLVVSIMDSTDPAAFNAFWLIGPIHEMLNVIIRLVIPTFHCTDNGPG
jgi:hypothetical protein